MKYGKYLIVTLHDFRRHFDFKQFYKNRTQFIADMHPDKVFYWDKKHVAAYHVISDWIDSVGCTCDVLPNIVKNALSDMLGYKFESPCGVRDFNEPIIILLPDEDLRLPIYSHSESEKIDLKVHKIIASEESTKVSVVFIGDSKKVELQPGEVVYAVENQSNFITFLQNRAENEFFKAHLIDSNDGLGSILVIENKTTHEKTKINNVISFILTDESYMCITANHVINIGLHPDVYREWLTQKDTDAKPIFLKQKDNKMIGVLYSDGTLMSSTHSQIFENVIEFELEDNNIIKINRIS